MPDKSKYTLQNNFFSKLKTSIPSHISLVNELSDVLGISTDGAYRRLRGETALSMDEMFTVCKHFKISPEAMATADNSQVTFSFTPLSTTENQFGKYFNGLYESLKQITSNADHHMYFTAEDIPIFHYFAFPTLTAFKIYYWNKCILNEADYAGLKFDPQTIEPGYIEMGKKIFDEYTKVKCTELWSEKTVIGILAQIVFIWESSGFSRKEDAFQILDEVQEMADYLKKAAALEYKFDPKLPSHQPGASYTLYHLDFMMGNITVFVRIGELKACHLVFNTFNTLKTGHPLFCMETENWLNNMMKKATLISGTSEKHREKFFAGISRRIEETRARLI